MLMSNIFGVSIDELINSDESTLLKKVEETNLSCVSNAFGDGIDEVIKENVIAIKKRQKFLCCKRS